MERLHPGARWIFRTRAYFRAIPPLIVLFFWFIPFIFRALRGDQFNFGNMILTWIILYLVFILIIGDIYARMAYNRWGYEFTQNNLKIERGIIWKKYSNVPYERVQNVDIQRGVIARMFGFSSVMIQTAGFSYGGIRGTHAEGYIPAVYPEAAEKIREFLMRKIGERQGL